MQIQTGTCEVENGNNLVVASADNDWSQATVGSLFSVTGDDATWYTIAAVEGPGTSASGNWEVTLSVNYAGADNAAAAYGIHKDFTPSGLPLLVRGDVETALLINRLTAAFEAIVTGNNSPRFRVTKTADQVWNFYADNERVTWNSEIEDTANGFASNVYTVPAGCGGLWRLDFFTHGKGISGDTATGSGFFIRVNSVKKAFLRVHAWARGGLSFGLVLPLAVGDVVDITGDIKSGGSGWEVPGGDLGTQFFGRRVSI